MNFLIDVHLPINLSKILDKRIDCTSIHVNQILQKWNTTDEQICKYADYNNLVVFSKDADFKNSHFIKKTPEKLIRIALGNIDNTDLCHIFLRYLPLINIKSTKDSFYIEIDKKQIAGIE